jgi:hypothetical protein
MARDEAYQEAERRIEAAHLDGAAKLDLSGMELTELPEAIAQLTNLDLNQVALSAFTLAADRTLLATSSKCNLVKDFSLKTKKAISRFY